MGGFTESRESTRRMADSGSQQQDRGAGASLFGWSEVGAGVGAARSLQQQQDSAGSFADSVA
jgi:hypothetical protein